MLCCGKNMFSLMNRKVGQNEVKIGFALACNWCNTLFNVKLKNQINLIGQQPQPNKPMINPTTRPSVILMCAFWISRWLVHSTRIFSWCRQRLSLSAKSGEVLNTIIPVYRYARYIVVKILYNTVSVMNIWNYRHIRCWRQDSGVGAEMISQYRQYISDLLKRSHS